MIHIRERTEAKAAYILNPKPGSYPAFKKWVPKIGNCKILGRPICQAVDPYSMSWELYSGEKKIQLHA